MFEIVFVCLYESLSSAFRHFMCLLSSFFLFVFLISSHNSQLLSVSHFHFQHHVECMTSSSNQVRFFLCFSFSLRPKTDILKSYMLGSVVSKLYMSYRFNLDWCPTQIGGFDSMQKLSKTKLHRTESFPNHRHQAISFTLCSMWSS